LSYLSYRQRSSGEVRQRLQSYGHEEWVVEEAVSRLQEIGYLDDEGFAEQFSLDKARKYGPRRVRSGLLRAGIDEAVADRKVGEQFQGDEELRQALLLAERRYNSISEKSDKLARRVYNFLLRRGYSPSVCAEVAREYLKQS
jgi:regulatory protein